MLRFLETFTVLRLLLPALALAAATLAAPQGAPAAQLSIGAEVANRIASIEKASTTDARIESAAHLAEYIASRGPVEISNLDPPIIDGMAQLLTDNDDWVRFYVAAALGFLGPSARRAIPALERALERTEPPKDILPGQTRMFSGITSAQAICAAFAKIDLTRTPDTCRRYP